MRAELLAESFGGAVVNKLSNPPSRLPPVDIIANMALAAAAHAPTASTTVGESRTPLLNGKRKLSATSPQPCDLNHSITGRTEQQLRQFLIDALDILKK